MGLTSEQLVLGLGWVALIDAALLYAGVIRRRAGRRRRQREAQEVGLRSLVRVMLVDHDRQRAKSGTAERG